MNFVELVEIAVAMAIVWGIFGYAWRRIALAGRRLEGLAKELASATPSEVVGSESTALAAVRRWLATESVGSDEGRPVIRGNPVEGLRATFRAEFDRDARAGLGTALTGIALVVTFSLIAWVMFSSVPAALRDTGHPGSTAALTPDTAGAAPSTIEAESSANNQLADAVRRMGLKFVVSASGVLASLLHRWLLARARNKALAAADEALAAFVPQLVSLDGLRLAHERRMLESFGRLETRLETGTERLSRDIARLQSIEVSVKDLGSEVSAGLGRMMKETLAEQLRTLLEDMKASAERIQEDVRGFADAALQRTADQIVGELRTVNETLRSQAGSQVEQLLTKLQDAVSGGFSAESRNMSERLAQFGEVIPRLGEQMDGVVAKMEGVLTQLAQQQVQSAKAFDSLAQVTRGQLEQFGESLARTGQDAVGRVLAESSRGVEQLLGTIRDELHQSHVGGAAVHRQMAEASQAVGVALAATRELANTLGEQMRALLAQQQAQSAVTLDAMSTATRAQAAQFEEAFARSGREALTQILRETSLAVSELVTEMRTMLQQSHQSSDVVRRNMAEAAQAVAVALAETRQTAGVLQVQMRELATGLAAAAQNGQSLNVVAENMGRAVGLLQNTVSRMNEVGTGVAGLLSAQQDVQGKQAELMQQMQSVWPQLLEVVVKRVRDSTESLNQSWGNAAAQLENATGKYAANLAESVEDLSAEVTKLQQVLASPTRQAVGR